MSCPKCGKKDFQFHPHHLAIERGMYLAISENTNEPYFFIAPPNSSGIFKTDESERRCLTCDTIYHEGLAKWL